MSKGIEVGRTTAVEASDENRKELTKMVRLILLSRCFSIMSIKGTQVRGVAIIKDPTYRLYGCVLPFKRQIQDVFHLICGAGVEALGRL